MRHIFKMMTFAVLFSAIFSSCSRDSLLQDQPKRHTTLHLNMDYPNSSNDSKAVKKDWANNDLVFLFFGTQMYSGYNTDEYVKLRRSGSHWIIENGQELLDALNDGEGYMQALHYTGARDPEAFDYTADYKDDGKGDGKYDGKGDGKDDMDLLKGFYISANTGVFALYTPTPAQYTKSTDDLTANLSFVTYDEIQLNIKFIENLNIVDFFIYDGDRAVGASTFTGGQVLGSGIHLGDSYRLIACQGIDEQVQESTVYMSFRNDEELNNAATINGSKTTYNFTNPIRFEILFRSGKSEMYYKLTRTISANSLTSGNVYTINGPTVSLSDLEETPKNGDVGNKWILSGGIGIEIPNSTVGSSILDTDFYHVDKDGNGVPLSNNIIGTN